MSRTEILELLIVVNVAITLAAIFYLLNPVAGYFGAISIAFITNAASHATGGLLLYNSIDTSTISGDQVYMYTVHLLGGFSFDTMMRLPVNHVLIAVALFCLGRRLTKSRQTPSSISIGATISILFLLNWAYVVEDMSFFVKGAGTFLYLAFVLLLLKYQSGRSSATLMGLLTLFVANGFFDYTAQVWMILAVVPFVAVGRARGKNNQPIRLWNVFVLIVVVFLGYRSIIYTAYVPWVRQLLVGASVQSFVHTLPFFREVSAYPFQGNQPSTPVVFVANAFAFSVTAVVTGFYSLRPPWLLVKRRELTMEDSIFLSLFLPLPLTIAIYLPIGTFNLSYAILILPLLSAYCIWVLTKTEHERRSENRTAGRRVWYARLLPAFLAVLLISGSVSFIASLQAGTLLTTSNSNMNPGAAWLFEETSGKVTLLSDIQTLGKLLIVRANFPGRSFDDLSLRYYDPQLYSSLVRPDYRGWFSGDNSTSFPTYVVIDARTEYQVSSVNWQTFEPLSRHLLDLQKNAQTSQIYDDGTSLILFWTSG